MLAPDQRYHLAKARLMHLDQAAAMLVFLSRHAIKHLRRGRVTGAQPLRIGAVNAGVILLG
jgi:hypothetical protein